MAGLKVSVLAEPIMVGRERELEELQRCLDSAVEGKGTTVFISGEAGSGKTRLVKEFLNFARKRGITTLAGWCLSNAAVPYFPFFEAFNAYFSNQQKQEIVEVTDWLEGPTRVEQLGKSHAFTPQAWKDRTFVAVAKTLSSISTEHPVILFIDDVHWADSASLALFHYVARAIESARILLLATFRSEELRTDSEGKPHPLVETMRLMRREELFKEIKVTSLSQESISELASNMLDGKLKSELAEKLAEESQGNPLFVVESLRMLHERSEILQENGKWRLTRGEVGIPAKMRDIILQRLSCLPRDQRKLVDAASVIGEKFDPNLLASVLARDLSEVVEALDLISKSTSLLAWEGEFYQFDHARTRDTVYEEISPALKKLYHAKVGDQVEKIPKGKLPLSELAFHYANAGDREKSIKYALAAGQDALERWSNAEAIAHFTYVQQTVGEDPEFVITRETSLEGLGDAYYANSMFKDADRIFEKIANTTMNDALKLRAFRKAMEAVFQYGNMEHLMELIKEAEPFAAADRVENARILGSKARTSLTIGGPHSTSYKIWKEALPVFEEEYSLWDVAWALIGLGSQQAMYAEKGSDMKEGLAQSLRSIALFQDVGDFRWQMEACFAAGIAFAFCLLYHEALELFARIAEIDERMKMSDYLRLAYSNAERARTFEDMGNFKEALSWSMRALDASERTDSPVAQGMVYSNLVIENALLGNVKQSKEYFDRLMKLPPKILDHVFVQKEFAKTIFYAASNQRKEYSKTFQENLQRFRIGPERLPKGALLRYEMLYAWIFEKQGRFQEAKNLREEHKRAIQEVKEIFAIADVKAFPLIQGQVVVGEEFEIRLDLVNVSSKPALLVEVRNILIDEFKVMSSPTWCRTQDGIISMGNEKIGAFHVRTAKLTLKSLKAGAYALNPQLVYANDLGEIKTFDLRPITITANPPAPKKGIAGKVSTGTPDLDQLLLGGIPEDYAVVLAAPSSDERALLIERFLEAGVESGDTTFYITTQTQNAQALAEKSPPNLYLFICNPRTDTLSPGLPNVFRIKGVENLTEIDISLARAFRMLDSALAGPKRICIEIISDVLLQHGALITRKWLNGLLPDLRARGFTLFGVIDASMHTPEETQAIIGLFDGEMSIYERETPKGPARFLKVKRMTGQKYVKDEMPLANESSSA